MGEREEPVTRRLAVLAMAAALSLAGCQIFGVRVPAPAGFRDPACAAFEYLTLADAAIVLREGDDLSHLRDDLPLLIAEGHRWLDAVPMWDPGAAFVLQMRRVADAFDTSGQTIGLDMVRTEYRALYDKHGFTCDWVFRPRPSHS